MKRFSTESAKLLEFRIQRVNSEVTSSFTVIRGSEDHGCLGVGGSPPNPPRLVMNILHHLEFYLLILIFHDADADADAELMMGKMNEDKS